MLVSKSALAGTAPKLDTHHALPTAAFSLPNPATGAIHSHTLAQIPTFLPHEFRRPMRN